MQTRSIKHKRTREDQERDQIQGRSIDYQENIKADRTGRGSEWDKGGEDHLVMHMYIVDATARN